MAQYWWWWHWCWRRNETRPDGRGRDVYKLTREYFLHFLCRFNDIRADILSAKIVWDCHSSGSSNENKNNGNGRGRTIFAFWPLPLTTERNWLFHCYVSRVPHPIRVGFVFVIGSSVRLCVCLWWWSPSASKMEMTCHCVCVCRLCTLTYKLSRLEVRRVCVCVCK